MIATNILKGNCDDSSLNKSTLSEAPNEAPILNNKKITFTPPPGWCLADKKDLPSRVSFMVVGKGNSTFPPSINMATEPYKGTLKEYLKRVKEINKGNGCEWKDLGTIKTLMGNGSLSQVDIQSKWGCQRLMHVIILQDDVIYVVTASALKEEFTNFYKEIFEAFKSLKIIEETPSK